MDSEKYLINDMEVIKATVTNLSEVLKNSGMDWKDDRYNAFVAALSNVTSSSRKLIGCSEKYQNSLKRFTSASNS